jgi:UDPglucose--hexose-1-phosphate uridylyltransferase
MNAAITKLVNYAVKNGLITEADRVYTVNRLLECLGLDEYESPVEVTEEPLCDILKTITDYAVEQGLTEDSVV